MVDETKPDGQGAVQIIEPARKSVLTAGAEVAGFIPRTLSDLAQLADAIIQAGMVPKSYEGKETLTDPDKTYKETKSKLMIGIMKGLEVGLGPMTAISTIAIINNRPCIYGDGGTALIQQSGKLEKMTVTEIGTTPAPSDQIVNFADDYGIEVKMWRRNQSEPYVGRFTVADAKRAHLWMNAKKTPWIEHPKRQLKWRAFSWPARDGFADCLMGLSIAEEVHDLPEAAPAVVDVGFLEDKAEPAAA
jgi:hypothetical protein